MKRFLALCLLVFIGVSTWIIGSKLSADAIGMGVGVLFGVMAGIPTALLLLASNRRNDAARNDYAPPPPRYPQQPPVIVFAAPHQTQPEYDPYGGRQGYAPALPESEYSILPPVPWDGNGYAPARPTPPAPAAETGQTSMDGRCAGKYVFAAQSAIMCMLTVCTCAARSRHGAVLLVQN